MKSFSDTFNKVSSNSNGCVRTETNLYATINIDDSFYKGLIRYCVAGKSINGVIVFAANDDINIDVHHHIKASNLDIYKPKFRLAYKGHKQENGSYDYIIMFSNI